ncbi:MAG: hypothetical protein M3Q71_02195 [Chloroflexota bacterium]|nr:hypothetical protein [Chloroflexota bacterium]MDP9469464.1 hypothetical protein [Chloroflexota bacterium]
MSAPTLLADLRTRGVHLDVDGDQIRARFKGRALDPDLSETIKTHKPALIAYLREEESAISWRVSAMRAQIPAAGAIPFLVAVSGVPPSPNTCPSCGERFTPIGSSPRCHRCTIAASRALGLAVSAPSITRVEQPEGANTLDMFSTSYPDQIPRAS